MSALSGIRLAVVAAVAVLLAGCATPAGSGTTYGTGPLPPDGPVSAMGLVLDDGGSVQLCLGVVADSAPPQCAGIPVDGWTWSDDLLGYSAEAGGARWGTSAVVGDYDGSRFAVRGTPIPLALYDPMPIEDPCAVGGTADDDELTRIQDELPGLLGDDLLAAAPQDGLVCVDAVWDDGTWQQITDGQYGAGAVIVRSALTPVPEG